MIHKLLSQPRPETGPEFRWRSSEVSRNAGLGMGTSVTTSGSAGVPMIQEAQVPQLVPHLRI